MTSLILIAYLHSLQNPLNLLEPMTSYHWIPSPGECRRMMCYKPLEVTCPPLSPSCTSLCNGSSCITHYLYKGLLIKHRWSASRLILAFPSSTCHLHMSNNKFRFFFLFIQLVVHMPPLIYITLISHILFTKHITQYHAIHNTN